MCIYIYIYMMIMMMIIIIITIIIIIIILKPGPLGARRGPETPSPLLRAALRAKLSCSFAVYGCFSLSKFVLVYCSS